MEAKVNNHCRKSSAQSSGEELFVVWAVLETPFWKKNFSHAKTIDVELHIHTHLTNKTMFENNQQIARGPF